VSSKPVDTLVLDHLIGQQGGLPAGQLTSAFTGYAGSGKSMFAINAMVQSMVSDSASDSALQVGQAIHQALEEGFTNSNPYIQISDIQVEGDNYHAFDTNGIYLLTLTKEGADQVMRERARASLGRSIQPLDLAQTIRDLQNQTCRPR
jgi:hypothetical protein